MDNKEFTIQDLPKVPNIAKLLKADRLDNIARLAIDEFKIDKESRKHREEEWEASDKSFKMQREPKSYPFNNSSNVKYPLLMEAAIDFQSRAFPAVVNNGRVVKGKVVGSDPSGEKSGQADRVSDYMNWQFLERDDEWVEDTDKMLLQLPMYGNAFKKLYHHPSRGNVSERVSCKDLVINNSAFSLERAPRITQIFDLYPYEIEERKRDGRFLEDFDIDAVEGDEEPESVTSDTGSSDDEQRPHTFYEQHRFIDLDEDGYPEPYIVTLHKSSEKVVRIVAGYDESDIMLKDKGGVLKIKRRAVYVKYGFIPDPEGGFYDIGFGTLLHDPVQVINSLINQIMDAGSLQNAGGGFIGKEFRLKSGRMQQEPGAWKQVPFAGSDIRQAIVPFSHAGPSKTLFEMLGFMTDMAKNITAQRDVLDGSAPANQPASTTLALIEQGLKVFTGIVGRVLRSVNAEARVLFDLNARFADEQEYFTVGDSEKHVLREDFNLESFNIVPVADSSITTDAQKMARAQMVLQFMNDPFVNQIEMRRRYFESAGIEIEGLLQEPEPGPPPPELIKLQAEQERDMAKLGLEERKVALDEAKAVAEFQTPQIAPDTTLEEIRLAQDAQLKREEIESRERIEREKMSIDLQKKIAELQAQAAMRPVSDGGHGERDMYDGGSFNKAIDALSQLVAGLQAAQMVPKRVVRDGSGDIIGVEPVLN